MSCIFSNFEKQIVLRVKRLIHVLKFTELMGSDSNTATSQLNDK